MTSGPATIQPRGGWIWIAGAWAIVGFISASQFYLATRSIGHDISFGSVLFWELPVWFLWAPLTPLVFALARAFPLRAGKLTRSIPVHIVAAAALSFVYLGFWMFWNQTFSPYAPQGQPFWQVFWTYFRARFNVGFLFYWAVIGVFYVVANYRAYRQREIEASEARAELARAELRALKLQLNPHFLFNTLHTVASLMDDDIAAARRVLARLSELLRTSLEREDVHEAPLAAEMQFLGEYIEIEKARFGDRLQVELDVPDELLEALVPTFLLQPLVENAIRHGVTSSARGGRVSVSAAAGNGRLLLRVEDDGGARAEAGRPRAQDIGDDALAGGGVMANGASVPARPGREGIGLANTRARLSQLYGNEHRLELRDATDGGTLVEVELPYHTEPVVPQPAESS